MLQIFPVDFTLSLPTQISWVKLFRKSKCFEKEAALLCLLGSTLYVAFSKCKLSWISFFDFSLALLVQLQKSSDIAPFLEHPIYSIFKVKNIFLIILSILIDITFNSTSKTILFWKFLVLHQRWVSISIYLTKFTFSQQLVWGKRSSHRELLCRVRSVLSEVLYQIGAFKVFVKLSWKHPLWSLLFQ